MRSKKKNTADMMTDNERIAERFKAIDDLNAFVSLTHSLVAAWETGDLAAEVNRLREFAEDISERYSEGKW